MAVMNSFARFFGANYPLEQNVLNTAPTYGDSQNILSGSYDPAGGGPYPSTNDVRKDVAYGTGQIGTCYVPQFQDVREGVRTDSIEVGNLRIPDQGDVRNGVFFNSPLEVGTCVVPPASKVEIGFEFDDLNDPLYGELDPGAGGAYPSEDQVLLGVSYNVDKVGTVRVPPVGSVVLDYDYGPSDSLSGNVRVPVTSAVIDGYLYGAADSLEGLLVLPVTTDVRLGTSVGQGTGTLIVPAASSVRAGDRKSVV